MSQINNNNRPAYQLELQGIRAIAVIAVILAHMKIKLFSGGFIGVDVFFVLSGYLISNLLIQEHKNKGVVDLLNFYSRRIKRLLPSLTMMIVVVMLLSYLLLPNTDFLTLTSSWISALTWSSNFYFAFSNVDYFSTAVSKDIFLHTWSLAVEEQFYLLWPLLFLSATLQKTYKSTLFIAGYPAIFTLVAALALLSFIAMLYLLKVNPHQSYYLMPSRIWQFCFGALVSMILTFRKPDNKENIAQNEKTIDISGIVGLSIIVLGVIGLNPNLTYPGFWGLIPSIGTVLIIWSCNKNRAGITARFLSNPLLVWIGDRSYSLYLWHWPIMILGFILFPNPSFQNIVLITLCFVLISILNYRFIEILFWKGKFSNTKPKKAILVAFLITAIVAVSILVIKNNISKKLLVDNEVTQIINNARSDLPEIYAMGCDTWYSNAAVQPCITSDVNDQSKTVVFIGDSIGAQWMPAILDIYKGPEWKVVILTKSACAIVDEDYFYERIGKEYRVCSQWRDSALKSIQTYQPDIIILGSSSIYTFDENQWVNGSSRIFSSLSKLAKNTIVIAPTPTLSFNAPNCLLNQSIQFANTQNNGDSYAQFCSEKNQSNSVQVSQYLLRAMEKHTNIKLLKLNDLVCPNNICSSINKNLEIVYRDDKHLTASFVLSTSKVIKSRIHKLQLKQPTSD